MQLLFQALKMRNRGVNDCTGFKSMKTEVLLQLERIGICRKYSTVYTRKGWIVSNKKLYDLLLIPKKEVTACR